MFVSSVGMGYVFLHNLEDECSIVITDADAIFFRGVVGGERLAKGGETVDAKVTEFLAHGII